MWVLVIERFTVSIESSRNNQGFERVLRIAVLK